jgi:hypothetical protein
MFASFLELSPKSQTTVDEHRHKILITLMFNPKHQTILNEHRHKIPVTLVTLMFFMITSAACVVGPSVNTFFVFQN